MAAHFLFAGGMKMITPVAVLAVMSPFPGEFIRFIGICEVLGAFGLILPWALGIRRELTPLVAGGLAIIMVGATVSTLAIGGGALALVDVVIGVLAASIAYGCREPSMRFAPRRRGCSRLRPRQATAEEPSMQITRSSLHPAKGPEFTGDVYIATVAAPTGLSRARAALVHFTPGARTAWHTHPLGQTIYVTEGNGRCQRRGGPVEEIRPGDRVFFEPGEEHWHGAAPNRFMTHLVMQEADESGSVVTWGELVTDEEYGQEPA